MDWGRRSSEKASSLLAVTHRQKRSEVDEGSVGSESLGAPREAILCLLGVDS